MPAVSNVVPALSNQALQSLGRIPLDSATPPAFHAGYFDANVVTAARQAWQNQCLLQYALARECAPRPVPKNMLAHVEQLESSWRAFVASEDSTNPIRTAMIQTLTQFVERNRTPWQLLDMDPSRVFAGMSDQELRSLCSAYQLIRFKQQMGPTSSPPGFLLKEKFAYGPFFALFKSVVSLHLLQIVGDEGFQFLLAPEGKSALVSGGVYLFNGHSLLPPGYFDRVHEQTIQIPVVNEIAAEPWRALSEIESNLGQVAKSRGALRAAVSHYDRALQLYPDSADFHINLGEAYVWQRQPDKAMKALSRAQEINPTHPLSYVNMSSALEAQDKLDEAIKCLRTALVLNPKFGLAHYNLGVILSRQGNLDQAISCYQVVIELEPHNAYALCNLGCCYANQRQWDKAIDFLSRALELNPSDQVARRYLQAVNEEKNKPPEDES